MRISLVYNLWMKQQHTEKYLKKKKIVSFTQDAYRQFCLNFLCGFLDDVNNIKFGQKFPIARRKTKNIDEFSKCWFVFFISSVFHITIFFPLLFLINPILLISSKSSLKSCFACARWEIKNFVNYYFISLSKRNSIVEKKMFFLIFSHFVWHFLHSSYDLFAQFDSKFVSISNQLLQLCFLCSKYRAWNTFILFTVCRIQLKIFQVPIKWIQ